MNAQAALGFLISQAAHIEKKVNKMKRTEFQFPFLTPVDTEADDWALTVTFTSENEAGEAKILNLNADDIPLVDTEDQEFETKVYDSGLGYSYTLTELYQAMRLKRNLSLRKAKAARRGHLELVESIALRGDPKRGFQGLINHSSVAVGAAKNGGWEDATAQDILDDINGALEFQGAGTNYITSAMANTILLPHEKRNLLATRPFNNTSEINILTYLQKNNVYTTETGQPLTIRTVRGLETAGAGNTKRMVAYRRDDEVLKLHMPMPHKFLTPFQVSSTKFTVAGMARFGGLDIRRPKEFLYTDGI